MHLFENLKRNLHVLKIQKFKLTLLYKFDEGQQEYKRWKLSLKAMHGPWAMGHSTW